MDEFVGSVGEQMHEPRGERRITPPPAQDRTTEDRPFRQLTIRELIVELSKVEDAQAHRLDGQSHEYSERSLRRRETQLIAELHRRRSLEAVPAQATEKPFS